MSSYPAPTRMIQDLQETFGQRLLLSWPVKDLPLNIRPVGYSTSVNRRSASLSVESVCMYDSQLIIIIIGHHIHHSRMVDLTRNTGHGTHSHLTYK